MQFTMAFHCNVKLVLKDIENCSVEGFFRIDEHGNGVHLPAVHVIAAYIP